MNKSMFWLASGGRRYIPTLDVPALEWMDDDTISVAAGTVLFPNGGTYYQAAANITFANLDTGARTVGRDYAVFATPGGIKLTLISTYHASGLLPAGYTADQVVLLGYFHNGAKADGTVGPSRNQAIFRYSVTNNTLLNANYPYRTHKDLPAGVPLPGMIKVGALAIGIYQASREDATASANGTSAYPTSRYGVVPWAAIQGWDTMAAARNAGCRLPTWEEWLGSAEWNPGSSTPARMNGNTVYGSASDDAHLDPPGAPTVAVGAAGALTGAYQYKVTLVNALGETTGVTASAVVNPSSQQVSLSAIPIGAAGTTARNIYRTAAGGATYKFLVAIADNTTTTYTDNALDATLGAAEPAWNTTGAQQGQADPTVGGRTLTGTGPRTALNATVMAGRSWYSPAGLADIVGNIWEWVAQFFGGLLTSSPGAYVSWGYENDGAWNFSGQAYNPDTGGYTAGLPAMLLVGGGWTDGSLAGVRAADALYSAGTSHTSFGFRLSR